MLTKLNEGTQAVELQQLSDRQSGNESDTSSTIDERELNQKLHQILTMLEQRKPEGQTTIDDEADFDDCGEVDEAVSEEVFSQQLSQSALDVDPEDLNLYAIQMNEVKNTEQDENFDAQLKNIFSQLTES